MTKQKAIIFDIDATAIDSPTQKMPSERLVKAIEEAKKYYCICAATGRAWSFGEHLLKGMGLTDPCVITSGTQICNPQTGEIFWQANIKPKAAKEVINILRQYNLGFLMNDYTEEQYFEKAPMPKGFELGDQPAYFLEATFVHENKAPELMEKLSKIDDIACTMVLAQQEGFKDIHLTSPEATKENAIGHLLKMLGINKNDTIGVGDGHNDLHLFYAVNHKVAVSNAVPEIKKAADMIIGDVKDDAFAQYLEEMAELSL